MSRLGGSKVTRQEIGELTHSEIQRAAALGYKSVEALQAAVRLKRGEKVRRLTRRERREQLFVPSPARERQRLDRMMKSTLQDVIHE